MKRLGLLILVVSFVSLITVANCAAQTVAPAIPTPQATSNTPTPQTPSELKFIPPHPVPKPVPGQAYAFDLCHGGSVNIPRDGSNNPDWTALEKDISQNQCGGPFDKQQTTVTGTDGPVHFDLEPGYGFPPLGMHLGLNGLLYGTPKPHQKLWTQQPFRVCAVSLGGYQDCQPVPFDGAPAVRKGGNTKLLLLGGGAAAAAAVGAGMAMKSAGSSGGGCGNPPANIWNDCFSNPQSPNCPTDIQQYNTWCKCEGYAGGFSATAGSCQQ